MKIELLLKEFAKLNIPNDQYAIYGSGPMAIKRLKEPNDLDVIVKNDYYKELLKKYEENEKKGIAVGNIEIFSAKGSWYKEDAEKIIDRAEEINGFKFVLLEDVLKWKQENSREKDKKDIEIILEYLKT